MKKSILLLALFFLFAGAIPVQHAAAQSQNEMTQSAAKDFERADAELNAVYKKVMAALADDVAKEKLVKAQRAWVAFRDAQAAFEGDSERGGSMEPMIVYSAEAKLTRARVIALRELISDQPSAKK